MRFFVQVLSAIMNWGTELPYTFVVTTGIFYRGLPVVRIEYPRGLPVLAANTAEQDSSTNCPAEGSVHHNLFVPEARWRR